MDIFSSANPQAQSTKKLRRYIVLGCGMLLALIILPILYRHLTLGQLIIVTDSSSNTIQVVPSVVGKNDETKNVGQNLQNNKAISLKPGNYLVAVRNQTGEATEVVQVKARQTKRYVINLATHTPQAEPVANVNALYFAVGAANLFYLDQGTKNLYQIDKSNQLAQLSSPITFTAVRWADASFGVGQGTDNKLYQINNGVVSPLNAPLSTVFTISSDHTVYLASGKDIYRSAAAGFDHIFTASQPPFALVSAPRAVALISSLGNGPQTSSSMAAQLTVLDGNNKPTAKEMDVYAASWSPSSKYLAVTTDSSSQILDASLNSVAVIPNNNINNPLWFDDNTLLYSVNDQLWRYSVSSTKSSVIATTQKNHAITALLLDSSKSYVYMSVQSTGASNRNLSIYRFGLQGQMVPDLIFKLGKLLPWVSGLCSSSIINFTSPSILVQSFITPSTASCLENTQTTLQEDGFNISTLGFQLSQIPVTQ